MCRSERITLTATESFTLSFCLVCRARGSFDRRDHARQEWKLCQTLREAPGKQAFSRCPFSLPQPLPLTGSIVDQLLFFFFFSIFFLPFLSPLPNRIFTGRRGNFADLLSRLFNSAVFLFALLFFATQLHSFVIEKMWDNRLTRIDLNFLLIDFVTR